MSPTQRRKANRVFFSRAGSLVQFSTRGLALAWEEVAAPRGWPVPALSLLPGPTQETRGTIPFAPSLPRVQTKLVVMAGEV